MQNYKPIKVKKCPIEDGRLPNERYYFIINLSADKNNVSILIMKVREKHMKKKIVKSICSALVAVSLLSVAAVSASAAECSHNWADHPILVRLERTVVEERHECTICGFKYDIYKITEIWGGYCMDCCHQVEYSKERPGLHSDHEHCNPIVRNEVT